MSDLNKLHKILVLGGDGYCGWATALHLSANGAKVGILDSCVRRHWDNQCGIDTLIPISNFKVRVDAWNKWHLRNIKQNGKQIIKIDRFNCDVTDWESLFRVIHSFNPDTIIHFAEQRSAPYSMISLKHAVQTQTNNVVGTLNILYAMRDIVPRAHLIKLGTMGEYGTPKIDIPEGFLDFTDGGGRTDRLPFPMRPGSWYHLSKLHDSNNIQFACRNWELRCTDLHQGIVYGVHTEETMSNQMLWNRFDYDDIFGTALNRFCVQAAVNHAITVYGKGGQTRGMLNVIDTVKCIQLATENPPAFGEYRVFNQFTEQFTINEIAQRVADVAVLMKLNPHIVNIQNPRKEKEEHYYNADHTKLEELGLKPHPLDEEVIREMIETTLEHKDRVDLDVINPRVKW